MDVQKKIDERKKKWIDFLSMSSSTRFVFLIDYLPHKLDNPILSKNRIETAWKWYQNDMERLNWLEDDTIPCLWVQTGTEIFPEAFGCKVFQPSGKTPACAMPKIHNAREVSSIKVPDLGVPPLAKIFEIADELKTRGGRNAVLKMCDIQSPMDIAALIWDKTEFMVALYESPEAVKELAAKVKELLITFLDEWFSRYGRSFIVHCPYCFMAEGICLSEDEVGIVSPEVFEEFFLPELNELSQRYGGLEMHCCADSEHQWENFKKIKNLCLINLCRPTAEASLSAYKFFETHTAQFNTNQFLEGPAWTWLEQFPAGSHVVIEAKANTKEEALKISQKLQRQLTI